VRLVEYGFAENIDFQMMNKNVQRSDGTVMPRPLADHQLTIGTMLPIDLLF